MLGRSPSERSPDSCSSILRNLLVGQGHPRGTGRTILPFRACNSPRTSRCRFGRAIRVLVGCLGAGSRKTLLVGSLLAGTNASPDSVLFVPRSHWRSHLFLCTVRSETSTRATGSIDLDRCSTAWHRPRDLPLSGSAAEASWNWLLQQQRSAPAVRVAAWRCRFRRHSKRRSNCPAGRFELLTVGFSYRIDRIDFGLQFYGAATVSALFRIQTRSRQTRISVSIRWYCPRDHSSTHRRHDCVVTRRQL